MSYSSNGNRPKLSEKGLLTPDNCVVALIDHQGQMLFGTSNFDRQGIINNTVAIGKAARVFDVPVVLTTVETKSFSGNMWPHLGKRHWLRCDETNCGSHCGRDDHFDNP